MATGANLSVELGLFHQAIRQNRNVLFALAFSFRSLLRALPALRRPLLRLEMSQAP
ncbi:hypothetical protein D3C84_1267000 [compost metagenome]